ncbi:MAG: dihydroneopterin aldolase [Dehalococcoidia bacterium]|nr:dihydroneopterin aldolase [Dehalococcoidia bacterium]
MPDKIILKGLIFYGYHGTLPEERKLGQRFVVDVTLETNLHQAGTSDDLGTTVNYAEVLAQVKAIVEGPPCKLIEAVAERIAKKLLAIMHVKAVDVCVKKPQPPLKGAVMEYAGVEIRREKK